MSRLLVCNFKDFPPNGLSPTERGREGKHWQLIKCQRSLYYIVLCLSAPTKWFHFMMGDQVGNLFSVAIGWNQALQDKWPPSQERRPRLVNPLNCALLMRKNSRGAQHDKHTRVTRGKEENSDELASWVRSGGDFQISSCRSNRINLERYVFLMGYNQSAFAFIALQNTSKRFCLYYMNKHD